MNFSNLQALRSLSPGGAPPLQGSPLQGPVTYPPTGPIAPAPIAPALPVQGPSPIGIDPRAPVGTPTPYRPVLPSPAPITSNPVMGGTAPMGYGSMGSVPNLANLQALANLRRSIAMPY